MDCLFGLQGRGPGVCRDGSTQWIVCLVYREEAQEYVEMGALNGLFVWFAGKRPRSM